MLPGTDLSFQMFDDFDQRRRNGVIAGLGVKVRAWNFQLGQDAESRSNPVLAVKGYAGSSDRRQILELPQFGFNEFLPNGPLGHTAITHYNVHIC